MKYKTLMVQGTTSDAGKSTVVTALCRWFKQQGYQVAPFKPQNMALNSAVTAEGGEIGRAQAVQAQACHLAPHIDMNPVLLKPNSDSGAQVIIHGKAIANMEARFYHDYKPTAMQAVLESHHRLESNYDFVVVEGAGSPAEINLRDRDIANMGFAEAVDCPVILIADIDRGGVFAHLVGTLSCLSESEQARIKGFIINRFRGDMSLLQPGLDWLEQKTGKPVLGVLPYLHGLHLEAEDAVNTQQITGSDKQLNIIVPVLPRISNHTDFDPLRLHPQVNLQFIGPDDTIPAADLIILPGSKHVRADLDWLINQGWAEAIAKHCRYGGKVLGICGGFQMLGRLIHDPDGIESQPGSSNGLGLLDMETTLAGDKTVRQNQGQLLINSSAVTISGYEIHAGISTGKALATPLLTLSHGLDGAISDDRQIIGTYLHGLFEQNEAAQALLAWAGIDDVQSVDYWQLRENDINKLAEMIATHVNTEKLMQILEDAR